MTANVLGNPAFYLTYAVIQAAVLLSLIRLLDFYDRQPLVLVALIAAWGATGAAAIGVIGNGIVKGLLSADNREVFGNALAPPFVEEAAKGIALVAAVGPIRWIARRAGIAIFDGVGAGIVYGAAVGLGFAFTEDVYYLVDRARTQGLDVGFDTFLYRRDFFGPAVIHHPLFTASFGAGLGLAAWSSRRAWKIAFPALGFALAVLLHAINNGLVDAVLALKYGIAGAAAWGRGFAPPSVAGTAHTVEALMRVLDFYYLAMFAAAVALWLRYQRRVVRRELEAEADMGLIGRDELEAMFDTSRRLGRDWALIRAGQLERLRHLHHLQRELGRLALLRWRTRRFGGDVARVQRMRREVATLAAYDVAVRLPVPATPVIGRQRELAELGEILGRPHVRVLTLTGPGGAGKSRLAIELASQMRTRFAAGVFFVDLAAVNEATNVLRMIARTLDVREVHGESVFESLVEHLRDKHVLLVLDNFEHVLAAAPDVAHVLAATRRATVLATSRQALHLVGEVDYAVLPLAVPPADVDDPDALRASEAVALFTERARAADSTFELDAENARDVAEICRRLDGLPLAIELAAVRVKFLSPRAMLERLGDPLELGAGGRSDRPDRHQTLRAAIEWSHDLLDGREKEVLARLGIFVGGCALDDADAVCVSGYAGGTVDLMEALVDKSLVRRSDSFGGESWFSMLGAIREFALERLTEEGELPSLALRHAEHYARLSGDAERELAGAGQEDWIGRLTLEYENLRVAIEWALGNSRPDLAATIATSLGRFWEEHASVAEAQRWLEHAVGSDGALPPLLRAKALRGLGRLMLLQGDYGEAASRLEAALDVFRSLDERGEVAACLWQLGWADLFRGRWDDASRKYEASLAAAREAADEGNVARALATLGRLRGERGDTDHARALVTESLEIRRSLGDTRGIANSLNVLGRIAFLAGSYDEAATLLDESVQVARALRDTLRLAEALYFQALVARERGDEDADFLLYERTMLCRELGDKLGLAECLEFAAADEKDLVRRTVLFAAATHMRGALGAPPWPYERARYEPSLEEARAGLASAAFEAAWREGMRLTRERAVVYMVEPEAATLAPA